MRSHHIPKSTRGIGPFVRIFCGVMIGIIIAVGGYTIFNYSWWTPSGTSTYDTGSNTGSIPSVGDYLFGQSGSLSSWDQQSGGAILSWDQLAGTSGLVVLYPSWYIDQFNKALLILQNDSLVKTYIDTENLSISGFDLIKLNNTPTNTIAPQLQLQWSVHPTIQKLYILWVNKDGAYLFDAINLTSSFRSYDIEAKKDNIKPGLNTYYIIWNTQDNKYVLTYTSVRTLEWVEFYGALDKVCILDLCTDPTLPKLIKTWSSTITQQSSDGKTVIQVVPDQSITIAYKEPSMAQASIQYVNKVGDYYHKLERSGWEPSVSQSFVDKNGNKVTNTDVGLNVPNTISLGNLKYTWPVLTFANSSISFVKTNTPQSSHLSEMIKNNSALPEQVWFSLSSNLYVLYNLDKSQLKHINPSNPNGTYKIIPKLVEWMNKNIVYTVPSSDIGLHDTITAHFAWQTISTSTSCTSPKPNADPNAKFGIRPINAQYDIVWFWNCYQVK